jgi:hypothetical protein
MPVGLSPRTAPPIKFESVAISTSYLSLSTELRALTARPCEQLVSRTFVTRIREDDVCVFHRCLIFVMASCWEYPLPSPLFPRIGTFAITGSRFSRHRRLDTLMVGQ